MTTQIAIRIDISHLNMPSIVEEVIYFRLQPIDTWLKWVWYWEYLAARVKVKNPRRKVTLTMCNIDYFDRDLYIEKKRSSLLTARKAKLTKLMNKPINDDLFGWTSAENMDAIAKVKQEIQDLEEDAVNFYVPVSYVNKVKQWM